MPDRILGEAIDHFDEGVDEIAALVKEVKGLKRWRIILALVIVGVVGVVAIGGYVVHRQNVDRIEGCRGRNETFSRLFDFIEVAADSTEANEFVDGMRMAAIEDCDRDGVTVDDHSKR